MQRWWARKSVHLAATAHSPACCSPVLCTVLSSTDVARRPGSCSCAVSVGLMGLATEQEVAQLHKADNLSGVHHSTYHRRKDCEGRPCFGITKSCLQVSAGNTWDGAQATFLRSSLCSGLPCRWRSRDVLAAPQLLQRARHVIAGMHVQQHHLRALPRMPAGVCVRCLQSDLCTSLQ